jgi:hypothetical protein
MWTCRQKGQTDFRHTVNFQTCGPLAAWRERQKREERDKYVSREVERLSCATELRINNPYSQGDGEEMERGRGRAQATISLLPRQPLKIQATSFQNNHLNISLP